MNLHASSQPPSVVVTAQMAGIARIVRQICLLREQGDAAQAARLEENELAAAVCDLRLTHGPEALADSEIHGLFVAEERRVTEAVILSELLIRRLAETWSAAPPVGSSGSNRSFSTRPAFRNPVPSAGPPAIPDLLDAMLEAERPGHRRPPADPQKS